MRPRVQRALYGLASVAVVGSMVWPVVAEASAKGAFLVLHVGWLGAIAACALHDPHAPRPKDG